MTSMENRTLKKLILLSFDYKWTPITVIKTNRRDNGLFQTKNTILSEFP